MPATATINTSLQIGGKAFTRLVQRASDQAQVTEVKTPAAIVGKVLEVNSANIKIELPENHGLPEGEAVAFAWPAGSQAELEVKSAGPKRATLAAASGVAPTIDQAKAIVGVSVHLGKPVPFRIAIDGERTDLLAIDLAPTSGLSPSPGAPDAAWLTLVDAEGPKFKTPVRPGAVLLHDESTGMPASVGQSQIIAGTITSCFPSPALLTIATLQRVTE